MCKKMKTVTEKAANEGKTAGQAVVLSSNSYICIAIIALLRRIYDSNTKVGDGQKRLSELVLWPQIGVREMPLTGTVQVSAGIQTTVI